MGKDSGIEWTHHTFNPWWGCAKVSPACKNCYAETFAKRVGQKVWGEGGQRRVFGDKHWNEPLKWNAAAEKAGQRKRVFCASMADVFEDHPVAAAERPRLWKTIEETPWLDWLLLTKRPENIAHMIQADLDQSNVWLGTTAENQEEADRRIPHLLKHPEAAVRFVSAEPLLGPIDFDLGRCEFHDRDYIGTGHPDFGEYCKECASDDDTGELSHYHWLTGDYEGIDWVIVGGESGHHSRPFDIAWADAILKQCKSHHIAGFMKQLGAIAVDSTFPETDGTPGLLVGIKNRKGGDIEEFPRHLRVREFPNPSEQS